MYSVMYYFYDFLVVELAVKMRVKEYLECGRMHI